MDFATVLVLLVLVTGGIWGFDAVFFLPRRKRDLEALGDKVDEEKAEKTIQPGLLVEYARSFFPIFLIVLLLRSFLVEPFRIPSGSMMPTLLVGDFILVNKYTYGIRLPVVDIKIIEIGSPKRGDIVVFRYPEDPTTPFIKRIIGLPGDHVVYNKKRLYINGKQVPIKPLGTYTGDGSGVMMTGARWFKEVLEDANHDILLAPNRGSLDANLIVPQGNYFVMGDNRDNSKDSRYWGTVPDENLIGKAFMIWMTWDPKDSGMAWDRIGKMIQ